MNLKKFFLLYFLSFFTISLCEEPSQQKTDYTETSEEKPKTKERITSISLEAILKRIEARSITRSGTESTFIQLLDLLQELLGELKNVNNSLKEVAITTATVGVAAKMASDQLDLLLGE